MTEEVTIEQADPQELLAGFYQAYDYFNANLFSGDLPPCEIFITDKSGAKGAYYRSALSDKEDSNTRIDRILMNPVRFNRTEKEVLSTLAHEMVHHFEAHFGKPGRRTYHTRAWADSMITIGLHPSSTGEIGGAETGENITHYIVKDGLFDTVCDDFINVYDYKIKWVMPTRKKSPTSYNKTTYRCDCPSPWYSAKKGRVATCNDCGSEIREEE